MDDERSALKNTRRLWMIARLHSLNFSRDFRKRQEPRDKADALRYRLTKEYNERRR